MRRARSPRAGAAPVGRRRCVGESAFFGRTAHGAHLYVYNDGPAAPAPGSRTALRYKLKPAGGAWGDEQTFFDSGTKNSYPTLIEVAPGEFRAVWDSGTPERSRTHIRFAKFRAAAGP